MRESTREKERERESISDFLLLANLTTKAASS